MPQRTCIEGWEVCLVSFFIARLPFCSLVSIKLSTFKIHIQNDFEVLATTVLLLLHPNQALRIQICPKKGITPIFLFWGWDVSTINPTLGARGLDPDP